MLESGSMRSEGIVAGPALQARIQLPLLSRSPRLRSLRRFSPAIRRCSQTLFRLMPWWERGGCRGCAQTMDRSTMGL